MSISDKIREAREWSYCIDTLKASVDSMYEICRIQQNILGCEEAIMFLKNGIRDFLSLIDTIKIEQNWENSEKRPTVPIAWEIRGTNAKNNLALPAKNVKEAQCQTTKVEENVGDNRRINEKEKKKEKEENEWQLVGRKRGSARNEQNLLGEMNEWPFIASGKAKKAPKSAMDLPQTKASMAKMAYSRQLLFEKHKKTLLEKFNAKRRIEKVMSDREGQTKSKGTAETKAKAPTELEEGEGEGREQRIAGCLKTLIDQLSDDYEWKAMTEEEESLAQEEESLKKEIEEEEEEENLPDFSDDFVDKGNLEELPEKREDEAFGKEGAQSEWDGREAQTQPNSAEPSHYRNPGELAQLRAKLLSPTKRRRAEEIDQSSENKLRRAEELRALLKQEKAQRLHLLHRRVGEVRTKREQIQQKKTAHLEMVKERIQKAEENRQKSLEEIVQKAQEDEMKIIEINLLNSFEAANQRLGKRFTQIRERNRHAKVVRKAEEERQKRIEENKQQREEAEKRRKDAEEQRTKRLKDQANQRLERQYNALKHRTKAMEKYRAKVAEHSQKISQRKESELADKQKLLDKIQRKQEKGTENYEQCKEQVRRRAMELCSPRPAHLWAQTLADFGQMPSDLALQQRPSNSDRTVEGEAEETSGSKRCFRCGSKETIRNDLQLLAHIMSEEHLAKTDQKSDSLLQNAVISYDFMKNELERMTSLPQNSEEIAEEMSKSMDGSFSLGDMPMDKIIARNAEMSISDQNLMQLLMVDEIKEKSNANGTKKKRAKRRQKIIREFETTTQKEIGDDLSREMGQKTAALQKSAKILNILQTKVERLGNSAEEGQLEENELKGVQRKVTELISALRNAHNAKEKAMLRLMILRTKAMEKLLALVNLIGQRKQNLMNNNELGMRILTKSLALFGNLVDSEDTPTQIHTFGPKTALYLCDLFQQNAARAFVTSAVASPSPALSVAVFIVHQLGRLISRQIDSDSALSLFSFLCSCSLLEFLSLCVKRLDPSEFLRASSQSNELELYIGEKRLSVCEVITSFTASLLANDNGKREEIDQKAQKETDERTAEPKQQQGLARHNSAESQETAGGRSCSSSGAGTMPHAQQSPNHKVRLCAVLWMYCLSIVAFQHFRHQSAIGGDGPAVSSNSENSSASNPSSPSKNEPLLSTEMTVLLSVCLLRQFNAIAEFSSRQKMTTDQQQTNNQQTMLQSFLSVEVGHAMALRMTCIFRSILQFVFKTTNAPGGNASPLCPQMGALAEQCIRAIGHFAVGDIQNQLFCVFGWRRSLLSMLCTSLPLNFVHSEPQKHFLLPTLIAVLRNSPIGVNQIRSEFCLQYLVGYLKAAIEAKTSERKSDSSKFDFLSLLEPTVGKWNSAKEFFESISKTNDFLA
ncbi:hypothetical protein niasHS_014831 [Heterodera schachtii]|uniref:S phase cyclin A-associated protein in the endoplasmic reticulum N-terminal domain-containing protein n=1 Tax=Heterodera schachtii TaxID=97005 RepID=A0ABD2IFT7_HETSC